MAQYQVPQFIEVEDKIFGPLTFKQFIYLAGGGGITLLFFTFLPIWLAATLALPFIALAGALAFYKINERPFIEVLEHAIRFYTSSRLFLWKQGGAKTEQKSSIPSTTAALQPLVVPKISQSKLKDLAWSLNIKDRRQLDVANESPS